MEFFEQPNNTELQHKKTTVVQITTIYKPRWV